MSTLRATNLKGGSAGSAPNLPDGANVTGVITATSFSGSGANLTGIDATALKDGGGSVKIQANSDGAVVTGVLTATTGSFTGNISVGGTLTYEDVTNVDSVGMVTARNGVKVLAGGINAVGVVTATSYRGDGSQLTGIEAAPTVQLVADGSIAANTAVRATSGGKVATFTEFASALGSEEVTATNIEKDDYSTAAYAYDEATSRVIASYKLSSTSKAAYRVGTKSGNSITWGSGIGPISTNNAYMSGVCNLGADKFFIMFNDGNDVKAAIVTTTSSNTGSLGTVVTLNSNSGTMSIPPGVHRNPVTGNVILAYVCGSGNGGAFGQMCTVSGTTITVGSAVQLGTTGYSYTSGCDSVYDSIRNNVFFVFTGGHTNDNIYGRSIREPSSGTTVLAGTLTTKPNNTSNATQAKSLALAFDPIKDSFIVMWRGASNEGYYNYTNAAYDTSNHHPSFANSTYAGLDLGGSSSNSQNGKYYSAHYDSSSQKLIIVSKRESFDTGHYCTATFNSNSTLTFNSDYTEYDNDVKYPSRSILLGNAAILLPYIGDTSNTTGNTRIKQFQGTNLSDQNFIGFSKEAYTDGQTATINVVGNVTTQSGLTAGRKYFVQDNGSIGLVAANTSVVAGRAITSTTLLIQPA